MVEKILFDYIEFIKTFEKLIITKYALSNKNSMLCGIGNLFPKQGQIDNYIYQFHGAGCRLENNGVICEYNYYLENICFTLFDLKYFIISHPKYKFENLNDKFLELELYNLIEEKKLHWKITDDGVIWQVYQV